MREKRSKPPRSTSSHHSAPQKSSKPTNAKVNKSSLQFDYKKYVGLIVIYLLLFALLSFIFYRRFPDNYSLPNFYAEDGSVFARNLIRLGFFRSLGTTFNGYYIWGIYILEKIGFVLNRIFYGGQFANLPRSFALTSYLFLGFTGTLPALLFRKYLRPMAIVMMTLLIVFVPLFGWEYATIGTIGNLKFAFVFIAFLLLVYRYYMPEQSKKVYLVDLGILVCAYTNITVYIYLLFALLRYVPKLKNFELKKTVMTLLKDPTFQSLFGLGILLLPQLVVVKLHGVPVLKGYLDSSFNFRRTIEIFVSRSYLYGFLFPINKSLNDAIVVIIMLGLIFAGWWAAGKNRAVFLFGLFAVFVTTFTFVIKRTGVSSLFGGYQSGGPAQFFYAQNWIFDVVLSIALAGLLAKLKPLHRLVGFLVVLALIGLVLIPKVSNYPRNDFMAQDVGTIYAVGHADCKLKGQSFELSIYPTTDEKFDGVTRSELCTTAVLNYQPREVSLGLEPYHNDVLFHLGTTTNFTQTFVSPYGNLDGLNVYFSTFLQTVHSPYNLTLFQADCKTKLDSVAIHTSHIHDNSFFLIPFPVITASQNQTYCFSIANTKPNPDLLAVQLSKPNVYKEGVTTINGKPSAQDVVFSLHYK